MARPRTATKILEFKGSFKKHPERARKAEPKSKGAFPKSVPKHLTDSQKKYWREMVKKVPAGVLTISDVFTVELVVILWDEFRTNPATMPTSRITRLTTEMGKLGLSPSDRAKLTVDQGKTNDFDDV